MDFRDNKSKDVVDYEEGVTCQQDLDWRRWRGIPGKRNKANLKECTG